MSDESESPKPSNVHAQIRLKLKSLRKLFEQVTVIEADKTIVAFQIDILERANDRLFKQAKAKATDGG